MTVLAAPELAAYLDEPKQMPSGAVGKCGVLRLSFDRRGRRSVLGHLHRRAPLLVQQALYWDEELPGLPCVYIITTSGSVLQGDRFDIAVEVGADAMAHVTTQAATKIHSMDANHAAQAQSFVLEDNAYLEWLPGATIPHRRSRFVMSTRATVDPTATLLCSEVLMPGRKYHHGGELFEYDLYSSSLTAQRPTGEELFTEKFVVEPRRHPVDQVGVMGGYHVLGNAVLVTPRAHADRIHERVPLEVEPGCISGVSRLPNDAGLIYKVLGMERAPVESSLRQFWKLVRLEVLGASIPAAHAWG